MRTPVLVRALGLLAVVPFVLGAAAHSGPTGERAFTIQDPQVTEASALVALPGGLFATTNDSGDTGRVFVLDGTGATVGVTHWSDDPTDTEALAPAGGDEVWVGDIGDNTASRHSIQVAEVPVGRGDRTVSPMIYDLAYPDGAHNAETLLCDPSSGRIYVATKGLLGGTLYAAPAHLRAGATNRLTPMGRVLPIATDGVFWPDGRSVLIRNYSSATLYAWPSLDPEATFALPTQPQGEGIGVAADGTIYLSSEGLHSKVLLDHLAPQVERSLVPVERSPSPARDAQPALGGPQVDEGWPDEHPWIPWALGGIAVVLIAGLAVGIVGRRDD